MKKTLAFSFALACACGGSSGNTTHNQNPNCQPGTGTTLNASCDPGFSVNGPNKAGTIYVTFSGETLGQAGLPYPPADKTKDLFFVDGWNISFEEILVVLGNFRIAPGATQSPDQSVVGTPVATMPGPYVVDMHKPSGFTGKDGLEPAGGIFKWDTDNSGNAFDNSTRYSFSYDVMQAVYPATQVNLDSSQFADYALMVQKGWSKLYRGTATYAGNTAYDDPTNPNNAAAKAAFAALPQTIHFMFGWDDHGSLLNCDNPDFGEGQTNRGIQPNSSGAVTAQVTLHVDHAFWDILKHEGAYLRFDPIAAWAAAGTTAANPLDIGTLGHKPLASTFANGVPLPDRAPSQSTGDVTPTDQSNPQQISLNLNGVPPQNVPGLANFMAFSAQSQMHLNADGLCYVKGQNASDPFYSPGLP